MRRDVLYALNAARALVGDPRGQFATNEKLLPLLNHAQDVMVLNIFRNEAVPGIEGVAVVPSLAAFATSLATFFEDGHELAGLETIISMKERPAGGQDDQWTPLAPCLGDLPTTRANSLNLVFKWLGSDIMLPGADQATDLRIYGNFAPQPLTSTASLMIPGTEAVMVAYACAYLTRPRNRDLYKEYMAEARDLEDELMMALVREKQGTDIQQVSNVDYTDEPLYL